MFLFLKSIMIRFVPAAFFSLEKEKKRRRKNSDFLVERKKLVKFIVFED